MFDKYLIDADWWGCMLALFWFKLLVVAAGHGSEQGAGARSRPLQPAGAPWSRLPQPRPHRPRAPLSRPRRRSLNAANWQWLSASAFFSQYFRVYSPVA